MKMSQLTEKKRKSIDLSTFGKVPPQEKFLEEAILGACMLEKNAFDHISEILQPENFYVETHQKIFKAITELVRKSQPVDIFTVVNQLKISGDLEFVGGDYFITRLTNSVVSAANIVAHSRIIKRCFVAREMIRIAGEIISNAYNPEIDIYKVLNDTETELLSIGTKNMNHSATEMNSVLMEAIRKIEDWRNQDSSITGISSGFSGLDKITRGWQNGDLIIIAARPSVGKTAFSLELAATATKNNIPVGIWSLEMKPLYLVLRMLAAESGIILHKIQTGKLSEDDMKILYSKGIQKLANRGIYFDDRPSLNIFELRAKARRLKKKFDIKMIIVDYLQLCSNPDAKQREQEISSISRELKKVATELDIPVIALSQLSRDIEKRTGKKRQPQLSDLRESGAIEQDSDLVLFLWAPDEDEIEQDNSLSKKIFAKVAKQRNGVLGKITLEFDNSIQKFKEFNEDQQKGWRPINEDYLPFKD